MTKRKWGILAAILLGSAAIATPLKVWSGGETITYTDINANFSHIHSLMVGGHGPRLVNADVSGSAAISHSKLASPGLVSKLWVYVAACTATPCTISEQSGGITSVSWTSAGLMTATFAARANASYAAVLSARGNATIACNSTAQTTTTVTIQCFTTSTLAAANSGFSLLIMDVE